MEEKVTELLRRRLEAEHYRRLMALPNPALHSFVADFIELCSPATVFVRSDSPEDAAYIRKRALETGEERSLPTEGHTVHFDGYSDQARDTVNTKYLLPPGMELGANLNSTEKEAGVREVRGYLENGMEGRELYVCFFCLGPTNSEFSISCVQLTDSCYVAHSEGLLYRSGYEQFRRLGDSAEFFRFVHSGGRLVGGVSSDADKRRVYIDIEENTVYSTNTQYAGNTVGLKKLALRLALRKASREGWLTEHMLIMGVHGPRGRVNYFTAAFPSACGKTSTAMLPGESIVGDDIAYLRKKKDAIRAVNVEKGIFGIIQNVNSKADPVIWKTLNSPGEVIFSNVLVPENGIPYWLGKGGDVPEKGINHSGEWTPGKRDEEGKEVPAAHKNARYTVSLDRLRNCDPKLDDPEGVPIDGFIYGGRDSDTWVPVQESFEWTHGIITMGASLESETTFATLGKEGARKFDLMSIIDFLSVPLGQYIQHNLDFAKGLERPPHVFAVNYFLKGEDGKYLNDMADKRVWLKWMELRVHGDADAIKTPTGFIPEYSDLERLFAQVLEKEYGEADYVRQFTLRIPQSLAKIERIEEIYRTKVPDAPHVLFDVLKAQRKRLEAARKKHGDHASPL